MKSKNYELQNKWLSGLFAALPQTALAVIALLRFIVAVPLIVGGIEIFEFFGSNALAVTMSIIVVIALEIIGLLASLLTAYFRNTGMREAFWISLGIGLFSVLFNAFLLKSIENLAVSFVAQIVFQAFNALSFGLGEAVGFLVVSTRKSSENEIFLEEKTKNQLPELTKEHVLYLIDNKGMLQKDIAKLYGVSDKKISELKHSA